MKTLKLLSLVAILSLNSMANLFAGTKQGDVDTVICLTVKGKVLNALAGYDAKCKVELLNNAEVIQTVLLQQGKRTFNFQLNKNKSYTIRITKEGYISKLVAINTTLPIDLSDLSEFAFNTELLSIEEAQNLKQGILTIPVAFIRFDLLTETFVYDLNYATQVKIDLYTNQDSQKSSEFILAHGR